MWNGRFEFRFFTAWSLMIKSVGQISGVLQTHLEAGIAFTGECNRRRYPNCRFQCGSVDRNLMM